MLAFLVSLPARKTVRTLTVLHRLPPRHIKELLLLVGKRHGIKQNLANSSSQQTGATWRTNLLTKTSICFFSASLAYIATWVYLLIFWIVPTWSVSLGEILSIPIWSIIGTVLFFSGGFALLVGSLLVVAWRITE